MLLVLLACANGPGSDPKPSVEGTEAGVPSGAAAVPFGGDGQSVPGLLGLSPPAAKPAAAPKTDLCAPWAGQFTVPGRLSVVECGADRVALTGRGDLLESCAAVQTDLRTAGWADIADGTFTYALSRGGQRASLSCQEIPGGVVITVQGE